MPDDLLDPILRAQLLAYQLVEADNLPAIQNIAMSGLPNAATREVANTATKFEMQRIAKMLNVALRENSTGVTVVNSENVATAELFEEIERGRFAAWVSTLVLDVRAAYDCIVSLGSDTILQSNDLHQKKPGGFNA